MLKSSIDLLFRVLARLLLLRSVEGEIYEGVSAGRRQSRDMGQPHFLDVPVLRNSSGGHRSFLFPSCSWSLGFLRPDSPLPFAPFFPDEENSVKDDE